MTPEQKQRIEAGECFNMRAIGRLTGINRETLAEKFREVDPVFDLGTGGKYFSSFDALRIAASSNALEAKRRHDAEMSRIKVMERKRQLIPIEGFRTEIEKLCTRIMDALRSAVPSTTERNVVIAALRGVMIPEEMLDDDAEEDAASR